MAYPSACSLMSVKSPREPPRGSLRTPFSSQTKNFGSFRSDQKRLVGKLRDSLLPTIVRLNQGDATKKKYPDPILCPRPKKRSREKKKKSEKERKRAKKSEKKAKKERTTEKKPVKPKKRRKKAKMLSWVYIYKACLSTKADILSKNKYHWSVSPIHHPPNAYISAHHARSYKFLFHLGVCATVSLYSF